MEKTIIIWVQRKKGIIAILEKKAVKFSAGVAYNINLALTK